MFVQRVRAQKRRVERLFMKSLPGSLLDAKIEFIKGNGCEMTLIKVSI